jgi:hypothetical protein
MFVVVLTGSFLAGCGGWQAAGSGRQWWGAVCANCLMRAIASLTVVDLDK